jgi:1-aminocyclopropane-1-carboxylate deaminase/D-cysteine desulfhydrase-like pyridoxal-dependent ACC family enzyme
MLALFEHYPRLAEKLPHVGLGQFPTPMQRLDQLGPEVGVRQLFIKRDDLSGEVYGGNKVRKLEFLLGDALRAHVKEVVTFGSAGSNHALATAIYGNELGLRSISVLLPQPNARYVGRNLLMSHHSRAELHHVRNMPMAYARTFYELARHRLKTGRFPQMIPPGGSSPLGCVGYVNAAFELKEQISAGEAPEPDRIYVAAGTLGTAVGLMLGLKAAGLRTMVIPVRVAGEEFANETKGLRLFKETNCLLRLADASFPSLELSPGEMGIRQQFIGQGYAHFTEESIQAVRLMREAEGVKLEGTYTGKTMAAVMYDAKRQRLRDQVVLFWNTYNSTDFSDAIGVMDYRQLPVSFHRYFEEEVQPLDRDT